MKKLLVTGATGFLGSRIAEYYKEKYKVFAPGHREMDITCAESVNAYMGKICPDVVIHCAAVSDVGQCEKEPEKSREINVTGSENIAGACREIGAKCILCSSDQVYFGSAQKGPHSEGEILKPGNVYGRQKLFMEKSCLEINPDAVLLRLTWMYDRVSHNEKEHGDFMRTLLLNLETGAGLSFPVHDVRGITDVHQVITNLEKVFLLPGGVYNYGSPNRKNTYEMMCNTFAGLGLDKGKIHKNTETFADSPRDISMDITKLNACGINFPDTEEGIYTVLKMQSQSNSGE